MTTDPRNPVTPQLVIGVFVTLIGALLMLDSLNIIETSVFRPFKAAVIRAGLPKKLRLHDLRHTFAGWQRRYEGARTNRRGARTWRGLRTGTECHSPLCRL